MANLQTATIHGLWADASGRVVRHSFNIHLKTTLLGNYHIELMRTDALSVLKKIDDICEAALLGAFLEFPLDFSTSGYKSVAEDESSSRRGAMLFFAGEPGENNRAELVEILLGDPRPELLDKSGRVIRLKRGEGAVEGVINAVTGKARTTYGERVASYKGSIFRQKAVSKRSKQAA